MTLIAGIRKPTLLLDEAKAKRNLERFLEKFRGRKLLFRPHFKTHQSAQIGEWFRERGIEQITVSSLEMAEYFAGHGWRDILIAFPVNVRELEEIASLAGRISLSLLLESTETAQAVENTVTAPVDVWIKIDAGAGRTGIRWEQPEKVEALARFIQTSGNLKLAGILTHAGHSYWAVGKEEILAVYRESLERLVSIKTHLETHGIGPVGISVGDTPTSSLVTDFDAIDEIRPGNFLFYDVQQYQAGVCALEDIAVAVACPLVAIHPQRQEAVIYGGAIHFSKDVVRLADSSTVFGLAVAATENAWDDSRVIGVLKSVSQEHGIVKLYGGELERCKIGDIVCILPAHSCLTVQEMWDYLNLSGERITTMNSKS